MAAKNPKKNSSASTKDAEEISRFDALGAQWWDESGPMAPLHRMNPARLGYIRDQACRHFSLPARPLQFLKGLDIVDIGCGGGLVTEPLCRMGAEVTGIDAGEENIRIAGGHAEKQGLKIRYLATTAESLAAKGKTFDVVLALEIIEHVANPALFLKSCAALVRPGGLLILSTLNRTPKSFLLGIVAAEHILRWLPAGTHDWKKFMKPGEVALMLEKHGMETTDVSGLSFSPLSGEFSLSKKDMGVNYFLTAVRA